VSAHPLHTRSITTGTAAVFLALALAGCSSGASTVSPASEPSAIAAAPATGPTISGSGYSFVAPDGWSVPDDMAVPGLDVIVADLTDADGFADNINVVLSPAGLLTPDQVESAGAKELEGGGASDVETLDRLMVADAESVHLSAGFPSGAEVNPIEQFYFSDDAQTYIVTFSFSATVPQSDRVALSESVLATWAWAE
jgi:hypothetical protein